MEWSTKLGFKFRIDFGDNQVKYLENPTSKGQIRGPIGLLLDYSIPNYQRFITII